MSPHPVAFRRDWNGNVETILSDGSSRKGDWMQLASGGRFYPMDPRPEEIHIEDIAHSLSMLNRFNGHASRPYSVAEHSVRVARLVPPDQRLAALLHDASEAYLADVPRPVKPYLPEYKEAEHAVEKAIAERFGLDYPWHPEIKRADNIMLATEARELMGDTSAWGLEESPIVEKVNMGWGWERAKQVFLDAFENYST